MALTHQRFIDNIILMGLATIMEAMTLKQIMNSFREALGTQINPSKYQVYFFNTN